MSYYHHGTIRKYTAALLGAFNDIEIQYEKSTTESVTKEVPIVYGVREKSRILDKYTTEQLLSGNYNVLPRASLSMAGMDKAESRTTNKNRKINQYKTDQTIDYQFNSVPYTFNFELIFQCRGMNEVTQIVEQIAPKFNPTVDIDVWDATNLNEPTRVPVKLESIDIESEEYDELSSNIFSVVCLLSLAGNLYPPIKQQERIQEFKMRINEIDGDFYTQKEILNWDVGLDGHIIDGSLTTNVDGSPIDQEDPGSPSPGTPPGYALSASRVSILDEGELLDAENVEDAIQELATRLSGVNFELVENKNQPNGYAGLNQNGLIPSYLLPSFVDDIVEYPDFASFPPIGESGIIYLNLSNHAIYRWSGSAYVNIGNTEAEVSELFTTDRLLISNDEAVLPFKAVDGQINIVASIFEDQTIMIYSEYTCEISSDGLKVLFDPLDSLNGKYCQITYMAIKI